MKGDEDLEDEDDESAESAEDAEDTQMGILAYLADLPAGCGLAVLAGGQEGVDSPFPECEPRVALWRAAGVLEVGDAQGSAGEVSPAELLLQRVAWGRCGDGGR